MLILNGGGLPTLERFRHPNLGRLARPGHFARLRDTLDAGFKVALDNEAFSNWNERAFFSMLWALRDATHRTRPPLWQITEPLYGRPSWAEHEAAEPLAPWHPNLLWVTVPDVPFDAHATAERWSQYAPLMGDLPLALCIQDGAGDVGIPWDWPNLRCLFMAGSTEYKLSAEMAAICREGKRRGLQVHMGRCNSEKRIRYAKSLEFVDSCDGTGADKFRDTHLPRLLRAAGADPQLRLVP